MTDNRERIARMHAGKFSVPTGDPNERSKGSKAEKGLCFSFQRTGKCKFGDKCKYQHARGSLTSSLRTSRSGSRSGFSSRGSSPSRSPGSKGSGGKGRPRDKSKVPCRFFKSGRGCKRGDSCPFMHEGTSSPAAPTRRHRAPSPARGREKDKRDKKDERQIQEAEQGQENS